jgi:hypothetical protein
VKTPNLEAIKYQYDLLVWLILIHYE